MVPRVSIHAPLARRDARIAPQPASRGWFQFTRLLRGATSTRRQSRKRRSFNSRASCEARPHSSRPDSRRRVSIHAPLARRDHIQRLGWGRAAQFQFTRLLRGATGGLGGRIGLVAVSIHAPLARRDIGAVASGSSSAVSIHAPLARRDSGRVRFLRRRLRFNSRASCEARRSPGARSLPGTCFNSRASCEARLSRTCRRCRVASRCFNSRASCEARHVADARQVCHARVSIHAPLARRDRNAQVIGQVLQFQFTRLLRGATGSGGESGGGGVSIHAPLARRDHIREVRQYYSTGRFNSRASCEARQGRSGDRDR